MTKDQLQKVLDIRKSFDGFEWTSGRLTKSTMTGKLRGIDSLNTNPLFNDRCLNLMTCEDSICSSCYSVRMLISSRIHCNQSWLLNTLIIGGRPLENSDLLYLGFQTELVRLNSHGELVNMQHLENIVKIASFYPMIQFSLFTKRKDLINKMFKSEPIPDNLTLVYSSVKKNVKQRKPKHFHKVFSVFNKKEAEKQGIEINCGQSKCIDCQVCFSQNSETTHINELIK